MKLNELNQWIMLAANVGILASILFLAAQIQQNSQMMQVQAQALTTNASTHAQTDIGGMGENPLPAFVKYYNGSTDLTDEELMILTSWLSAKNSFKLYELGVISEEDWQSDLNVLVGYYSTPIGLSYWNATKVYYSTKYVEAVEPVLLTPERTGTSWAETIRNGAKALRD